MADKTPEPDQGHARSVEPGEAHQETVPAPPCRPEASAAKPALSPPGLVKPNPVTPHWRLRLGEIRYDLATKANAWMWAFPLVMAAAAFFVILFTVPVSPKGNTDRLVDVFGGLIAASIALSAVVFSWHRQEVTRFKVGLVILYCVLVVLC